MCLRSVETCSTVVVSPELYDTIRTVLHDRNSILPLSMLSSDDVPEAHFRARPTAERRCTSAGTG